MTTRFVGGKRRLSGGPGRMRLAAMAAGVCQLAANPASAQQQDIIEFDIAPGPAPDVVGKIAELSGASILFPYQLLAGVRSEGVTGALLLDEALSRALDGSNLVARRTPKGVITITAAEEKPAAGPEPAPRAPRPAPPRPAPPPAQDRPPDRVVVTGSRLVRPGLNTPVPVTAISRQELQQLSPTTLMDAIQQLPQFSDNDTPENMLGWSGSAGQSFLNLRGIGSNRTLVLIDGRRVVSSTRRGTLDIGLLPEALLERVEVVTGGASAAYGSDAVAGVVNFVLNTDFDGIGGHLQSGISDRGDSEHFEASVSAGLDLGPDTRLLLTGDLSANRGVPDLLDRDWHQSWGFARNPAEDGPTFLTLPGVVSSEYTYGGLITSGPLSGTQFLGNGQTAPFDSGDIQGFSTQVGGDGIDVARERTVSPETQRQSLFAYLTHDAPNDVTLFAQAMYGRTEAEFDKDPNYLAGRWAPHIYVDNAYLPDDIRTRMIEAGVESFSLGRYSSKRDLGAGRVNTENETLSLTAGFTGPIGDWRGVAYYQYGANDQRLTFEDAVRVDRIYRSIDSVLDPDTGQPVCRSTLTFPDDGCVPSSFFGDGAVSAEARDWILDENNQFQELVQHFAEITVNGEPFETSAGPVLAAFGASWRSESYDQYTAPYTVDDKTPPAAEAGYRGLPATYSDGYPVVERAVTFPSTGVSRVWEAFAEAAIPVIADKPLIEAFNVHGAVRYAYYSGGGEVWAWKAGADWTLPWGLRLRGTASRDVRAGTLSERFDRSSQGASGRDPFLEDEPTYAFGQLLSGNPEIRPERANTLTIGFVYQPDWLPGFGLSADYYDIDISDAISRLGAQTIIDDCFDGAADLCELISRDSAGYITVVDAKYLNIDKVRTRGVDIEASYYAPITLFGGGETLELRAIAALYEEASYKAYDLPRSDYAGIAGPGYGLPDYRLLLSGTYRKGGFSLNVSGQYTSSGLYSGRWVEGVDVDENDVAAFLSVNSRLSYRFETGPAELEVYLHVENMFDESPPIAPYGAGGFYGALQSPLDYDRIGRRYAAGISWLF